MRLCYRNAMDDKRKKRNAEKAQEQPGSMSSYNNRLGNREGSVEEATGENDGSEDNPAAGKQSGEKATERTEGNKT